MPPTRHTSMVMAVDSAYGYGYGRMATGMAMVTALYIPSGRDSLSLSRLSLARVSRGRAEPWNQR